MKQPINTIGIIGKLNKEGVLETLKALLTCLDQRQVNVLIEEKTATLLENPAHTVVNCDELSKQCDLVIVIGGDGSMLAAAHIVVNNNVPLLGINRGKLGFLTDITPSELEKKLIEILDGQYFEEQRFLLDAKILLDDQLVGEDSALNEVALLPGPTPHIIEFELHIDQQFVCSQHSDGLIIATPTGSTAYALSGGGPIVHPELDATVIVPMFPHSLNVRPIVINGEHEITLMLSKNNETIPRVSCDGQAYIDAKPGSIITINKKPQPLRLLHPLDYDYYGALREKLHWSKKTVC